MADKGYRTWGKNLGKYFVGIVTVFTEQQHVSSGSATDSLHTNSHSSSVVTSHWTHATSDDFYNPDS